MNPITFFFDANMSRRLADMAKIYVGNSHIIKHHDERFDPGTTDVDWIAALGKEDPKWVVISGDSAILKNKAEKEVLHEANLTFFRMPKGWPQTAFAEMVWKFFRVWPMIISGADVSPPKQFDIQLGKNPKIELVGPTRR